MTGQLDQPTSNKTEQSLESPVRHAPLVQSPLDSFPAVTKVEQPELKLQGNNIEVPPITAKGWPISERTTGNTSTPEFLDLPNPYQGYKLDIAGQKWTDLGATRPAPELTQQFTTEAPPPVTSDTLGSRSLGSRALQDRRGGYEQNRYNGQVEADTLGPTVNEDYARAQRIVAEQRNSPQFSFGDLGKYNPVSILVNAVEGVGRALWALTPFKNAVRGGRLGCAASVSEVLQRSGYNYANHAGVGGLESQLMRNGWTKAPLSEASPEDVVMIGRSRGWRAGGGNAHVGIVGENGTVYHNSSSRGEWIKDNLQARFGRGGEMFVLKPPADGRRHIDRGLFVCNPEPSATISGQQQWLPDQRQATSDQGWRSRGYENRSGTRYGDNSPQFSRYDRFQPYTQDPRYAERDQASRYDPRFDGSADDELSRRERHRMANADRRTWQQRMMEQMRRRMRG